MLRDQSREIKALLRSGRMINIGGRPVIATGTLARGTTVQAKTALATTAVAKTAETTTMPAPGQSERRKRTEAIKLGLAFAAIYLVWGSTYLAIRYAVETIPPLVTAGIRHSIAGLILLAVAYARGFRPKLEHWKSAMIVGGLFFLIGHGSLHWAEQYVASGLAALLIATEPMFILVLAWSMGQQRISRISALGLGLGVVGVALLTGAELSAKGSSVLGILAVLIGSLSWSLGVVVSPRLKLPDDALGRTALPTICGAAMLLVAAGFTGEFHATHWASISMKSLFGLGYLITFGSIVAFTAYTWLLQRCPPALVATHTYANPIVAVLLGWFLASEALTVRVALASIAILGAIVLIRRGERGVVAHPAAAVRLDDEELAVRRVS
jgi:drug/metabolite transporter (DMT)-like permease